MPARVDLAGRRFERLVAIRDAGRRGTNRIWLCQCDCGAATRVPAHALISGNTKSCGCLKRDNAARRTHGMSSLPEYKVWTGIIKRCTNPKCKSWRNYGGAGVTVCDRWRNSFEAFYADMGPRPGKDYDLDKDILIPGNKVYGPHACQWLKRSEHRSLSNKGSRRNRGARVALVDGIEMTCNQIAAKYGLRIATVWLRMKNGRTGADLIAPPDSTRKVVVKHLAA